MEILIDFEGSERPILESLECLLDEVDGLRGYDYGPDSDRADLVVELELEPGAQGTPLAGVETFKDRLARFLDEWADDEPDVMEISID
jgi:hypothetical protein